VAISSVKKAKSSKIKKVKERPNSPKQGLKYTIFFSIQKKAKNGKNILFLANRFKKGQMATMDKGLKFFSVVFFFLILKCYSKLLRQKRGNPFFSWMSEGLLSNGLLRR